MIQVEGMQPTRNELKINGFHLIMQPVISVEWFHMLVVREVAGTSDAARIKRKCVCAVMPCMEQWDAVGNIACC